MTKEEAIKVCIRERAYVQSELDACSVNGGYVSPDGIITAADYVEAMTMAIAALREQPRWISVEEALPPSEGVPVLAYNRDYCFAYGHMTTAFYKNGHWHGCTGLSMTHWMPLPEGPEVEV